MADVQYPETTSAGLSVMSGRSSATAEESTSSGAGMASLPVFEYST